MEEWLRQNLLNFLVILGTCAYAIGQIRNTAKQSTTTASATQKALQEHLKDPNPHPSCVVEAERYKNICDQLGKIEGTLKVLDKRTVAILANRHIEESDEYEAG